MKCASCEHYAINDCKTRMHSGCGKYVHNLKGEIVAESSEFTLCRGEELPPIHKWSDDTYCIKGQLKHIWCDRIAAVDIVGGVRACIASYRYYVNEDVSFKELVKENSNIIPFKKKIK